MSVICKNDLGVVVDHLHYLKQLYSSSVTETGAIVNYSFKPDFFEIKSPFMMDSQFEKVKAAQTETDIKYQIGGKIKNKKKRKLEEVNEGQKEAADFHEKIRSTLQKAMEQLVSLSQAVGHFTPAPGPPTDNNLAARQAATQTTGPGETLTERSRDAAERGICGDGAVFLASSNDKNNGAPLILNTMVVCNNEVSQVRPMLGARYLLPPRSSFVMSDFSFMGSILQGGSTKYDLILLDPPWQNKSVKRKHKYKMLDDYMLLDMPVPQLAADNCLIVIWATNKQKQHRFIKDELFTKWGVKYLTRWYWLKMTKHGELVVDLDNTQKKPYETLFLGYLPSVDPVSVAKDDSTEGLPNHLINFPQEHVILSVACSLHSHKPPLCDVFKPYLPENSAKLELFARNLMPGWTSWGNEVLKLQHLEFYEECSD